MDDYALLECWRRGDAEAGDRLARRHYNSVRRFFDLRLSRQAEDLTQRTFLACAENIDRPLGSTFRAYLFGIARHQMQMALRKDERKVRAMRLEEGGTRLGTSITGVLTRKREQYFLLLAIAQLPVELAQTVQLFYWEGMSTAEIAEASEVTQSGVTSRLARARSVLGETLQQMKIPPRMRASLTSDLEAWTRSLIAPDDALNTHSDR